MLTFIFLLSAVVICSNARPSDDFWPKNVVTVPPNCPVGQQWVNGECRDIWRSTFNADQYFLHPEGENSENVWPKNVVIVPPNCRPGQQWINGACRDVWRQIDMMPINVITVPPNCPDGQEYVNGECRDIWYRGSKILEQLVYSAIDTTRENGLTEEEIPVDNTNVQAASSGKNIISVPSQCPVGFKPDSLGICRPIFD